MTACVNRKHTKKVAAVVTASLVGALSLGVAPVAAMATDSVDMLADTVADEQQTWEASTFEWSADKDGYGNYTVEPGDVFALESVTTVGGETVNPGDYTVLYFESDNTLVDADDSITHVSGGMPANVGTYTAVVFKLPAQRLDGLKDNNILAWLTGAGNIYKTVTFKVAAVQKTLDGAYFYEVGADADDTSDTSFLYTGDAHKFALADADGNKVDTYTVRWISGAQPTGDEVTYAGTYTAFVTGQGDYAGSTATISFTVDKLDLSKVSLSVKTVEKDALAWINGGHIDQSQVTIYADGEALNGSILDSYLISCTGTTGYVETNPTNLAAYNGMASGTYVFSVNDISYAGTPNANIVGNGEARATFTAYVVDEIPSVTYDEIDVEDYFDDTDERVFETAKGEGFDPELLAATLADGDEVALSATVTKDGEAVTEYTEPGEYVLTLEVPAPQNCAYGYNKQSFKFRVVTREVGDDLTVFASVDGKAISTTSTFEYTGEAYVPAIVVKDGKKVVSEDAYTVSYELDGEAVESMVEPGDYKIAVSFPGAGRDDIEVPFKLDKAVIESAKAAKDVYAVTGEAVKPDFVGYTNDDLTGTEVQLSNAEVGVTYYKAKKDADGNWIADTSKPVNASNLKEKGVYFANVSVATTNEHYTGTVKDVMFEISDYAKFSDVDASAWYADAVYNAADLGYMTGIKGTDLFMPLADISRAELAQVFANMAGEVTSNIYTPTQFADVDAFAWYAEPVAWASEAGIVTGYDATTFGPQDKASREQVATMLYRYAKAQGKDVSVDDADAALAAYKDGDQVSDWAKTAMAWAVENGIFGVDTEELYPTENIQRCAVATIAVRFQPEALPEA